MGSRLLRSSSPTIGLKSTEISTFFVFFRKNPCFLQDAPLPPRSANILNGISEWHSVGFTKSAPRPLPARPDNQNRYFLKENLHCIKNRYFSRSRPLPARPGNQNRYVLSGNLLKIDTFLDPGRSRPGRAIKIVTF